jgi:hypothetical protein
MKLGLDIMSLKLLHLRNLKFPTVSNTTVENMQSSEVGAILAPLNIVLIN